MPVREMFRGTQPAKVRSNAPAPPPCALHHELHEKTAGNQQRRPGRENPRRNQKHPANRRQNNAPATAPSLRKKADDGAATNHADGIDDGDRRFRADAEAALFFEKSRVEILSSVRHVVECGHEQGCVD